MRGRDITDPVYLVAKELISLYGQMPAAAIEAQHVAPIVARWRNDYAKNTQHNRCKALRRILRELAPVLGKRLDASVPRIGEAKPPQQSVTEEQRAAILKGTPQWMRLFTLLCSDLGFRFSEALNAPRSGYDADAGTITLTTKGGETHTLPVTDEIRAVLDSIPKDTDPEKPMLEILAGKPIRRDAVRYQWAKAKRKENIPGNVRPHDMRRTVATKVWRATKDIRLVQQILGHKSLAATARYIVDRSADDVRTLLEHMKLATQVTQ